MVYFILIAVILIGGYFVFRYAMVLTAIREMNRELKLIQEDLSQNQMIHCPVPDKRLGEMTGTINVILGEICRERQKYERQEKEFKKQIENISHDLRTPLTVILGYLKFIKNREKGEMSELELHETLGIIERKAESMETLVTQFYDFSRLSAGDYRLTLERVDVCRILRETLLGNVPVLEAAHLRVDADLPEHPVWAVGDVTALERIFSNLLQNAGRYAEGFLQVSLFQEASETVISFKNDTTFLTEEDAAHLFERFYMQDDSRNRGGTGLGLTVAKALAKEMGARLEAGVLEGKEIERQSNAAGEAEGYKTILCITLRMGCKELY